MPFQGAALAMQSVLGGQTPIFHMALLWSRCTSGWSRSAAGGGGCQAHGVLPGNSDHGEAGSAGHEVGFGMGAYAVAGTPKPALDASQAQIAKIMALPYIKEWIDHGFDPTFSMPTSWRRTCGPKPTSGRRWSAKPNIKID